MLSARWGESSSGASAAIAPALWFYQCPIFMCLFWRGKKPSPPPLGHPSASELRDIIDFRLSPKIRDIEKIFLRGSAIAIVFLRLGLSALCSFCCFALAPTTIPLRPRLPLSCRCLRLKIDYLVAQLWRALDQSLESAVG